ncbi:tudor domain-containing protein 7B isoform X2 [Drosophila virilis]|uniref:Uncharacterized protein, isoform B n=3 Tax=Drosophila virilis TaxID=7244 RepID=B4LMT1_DROVI|nr:uncharacterized protein LOC6626790 isoform X1 [Drosophila virilis]EDW61022.2 uncharacterized protein Dvir_GJ20530, isoform B [Drosophila virilis]
MSLEQEEEILKDVTIVVRSLITSLKPPVSLRTIERDYMKEEHAPIPFRSLGYRSTLELLEDTNAFSFQKIGDEIFVSAKPNPKSAHIASMVRCQKSSKTKSSNTRPPTGALRVTIQTAPNHGRTVASNSYYNTNTSQLQQKQRLQQLTQQQAQQQRAQFQAQQQAQQRAQQQAQQRAQFQAHQQAQQRAQQQAQKAQQQTQQEELLRLRVELGQELERLRLQQDEQLSHEREIQRRQAELREEQRQQKVLLQEQQEKIEKQIKQLQEQHERGLQAQALTIEKLQEDRLELQRQLKTQELQHRQQREQEAAAAIARQVQQKRQQDVATTLARKKLAELHKEQEREEAVKKSHNPTPPRSPPSSSAISRRIRPLRSALPALSSTPPADMNGNATGTGGNAGAAARKPHLRPILGNSASQRPAAVRQPAAETTSAGAVNKRPPLARAQYPGSRCTGTGLSVNYRLKQQQTAAAAAAAAGAASPTAGQLITPPDSPENAASNKTPAAPSTGHHQVDFNLQQPQLPIQPVRLDVNFKFDPAYDAISSLKQYCVALGYAPPEYEFYNANKTNRLHCKVRIGESIYTSYPEEHFDEGAARQRASEVAIERLQVLESRKQLSILSDNEFLEGLYQELIKHPHGIVSHKLPEWYEASVKRQVPNNWWTLINVSPKMRIESSVNTHIVFANTAAGSPILQPNVGPTAMPELQLPWTDGQQDWSMYITHCDNTTHVWARLIEQSAQFEKLTEQLNAHMSRLQNRQPVQQQPLEHQIYAVEVSENWNRVRVMSLDAEQRQCSCHFVDFGDEVVFRYDALYVCPSQFLTLPAQAVCLSMYALDKFEEHPHALPVLAKELAGHSVVTRIITSEAQFHQSGGLAQGVLVPLEVPAEENGYAHAGMRRACIVGTFYDTSTAEDIHLNDLVANQIIRNTPAPMLKLDQKPNQVLVSHVNDVGDLMVQLPNEDLKFVQRSIAKIMSDSSEQHRVRFSDLLHDQLVCVCDEPTDGAKQWYRGMLTAKPKSPEEEVFDVYYVDDGRLRKTHISNIYRLEANNLALASYPAQALRVRLHDVPPIDNQMVGLLRRLLSPQTPVLLKVMEGANDKLPMVTIHARGTDSLYVCLNSAIRVEHEVQSTTRPEPFDDGGLHFSPSGQLIRRSSFSSTVSSQSSCSDQPTAVGIASPPSTPVKAKAALLPMLKEYEAIPALGAYFEVRVALSVNPGRFAVQPYKCYNQLQRMMKELQTHCKSPSAQSVELAQLNVGQAYVAADSDGVYHRVNIRNIFDEMIHVRYVDAGDDGVVRCNQLLQLTPEFRELPMMALPAQLHGIQLEGIDWTQENCVRFRKLTLGQKFIGIVRRVDKLKDNRRALSLELIDTSTPQDIKVHETLISEKHALAAP